MVSGDVDVVNTHIFVACRFWHETRKRSFEIQLFVILQKPKSISDIYNVRKMFEVFLRSFADRDIEMTHAVPKHIAWNDIISSCHETSNDTSLRNFVRE